METITATEYYQRHLETHKDCEVTDHTNGFDRVVRYPDRYINGYYCDAHLRLGLHLTIYGGKWLEDLGLYCRSPAF